MFTSEVKNIVTIIGKQSRVDEIISELMMLGEFTFETFAPMPYDLKSTGVEQEVIPDNEYEKLDINKVRSKYGRFEAEPISHSMQKKLILKYGYDNWKGWAMNHWGVEIGAFDSKIINNNSFSFYSADATPHSAMVKMSMKYPKVEFNIRYANEHLGENVGEYNILNGETISKNILKEFSLDSFLLAYDINPSEYHLKERIYELSPKEVDEGITGENGEYNIYFQAILHHELVDINYDYALNKYLLEQAVEYEQYEYAAKLKNTIDIQGTDF